MFPPRLNVPDENGLWQIPKGVLTRRSGVVKRASALGRPLPSAPQLSLRQIFGLTYLKPVVV
jgi:hypothetical protein